LFNRVPQLLEIFLVRRFGGYILIGGMAFTIDMLSFVLMFNLTEQVFLANFIAVSLGLGVSFTGNLLFNFKKSDKKRVRLLSFGLVAFTGFLIMTNLIVFFFDLGFSAVLAKICALFIVVPLQFIANAKLTFR
jgi:putative flippase GtrA